MDRCFNKRAQRIKRPQNPKLKGSHERGRTYFTALAELSTRQIAETTNATGMKENKVASKLGRGIAKKARKELEKKTGKKVVTGGNYLPPSSTNLLPKKKIKKKKKL